MCLCCLFQGEFFEVKCHEGPISRLHVSYDDCLLVSAGEDGSVVLMDIRDKELAKVSTRQQQVSNPEVLGGVRCGCGLDWWWHACIEHIRYYAACFCELARCLLAA